MSRPSHLSRDDAHFLAAVSNDTDAKSDALQDAIGEHFDVAEAEGFEPDEAGLDRDLDQGLEPDQEQWTSNADIDQARRSIRGRTRELRRQAEARRLAEVRAAAAQE